MIAVERASAPGSTNLAVSHKRLREKTLMDLPRELTDLLLGHLDGRSLSVVACVCKPLNAQACQTSRWKELFDERWGSATHIQHQAAEIAGGWKALYISKVPLHETCPSKWETQAALDAITSRASSKGVACCALIDGSGSMGAGDFEAMSAVVTHLCETLQQCPDSQFCVIQFSGRAQVEIPLLKAGDIDCAAIMKRVTRMNGGTNAAAACLRAAAEMESLDPDVQRVIVFMSDFRIDEYSAQEAVAAAKTVVKAQPKTAIYAFGVGPFADLKLVRELVSVGSASSTCMDAYLSLGCKEEDPQIDDY